MGHLGAFQRWGRHAEGVLLLPGPGFPLGEGTLGCAARVRFPGPAPGLAPAAVEAAVGGVPPGFGCLRAVCAALSALAEGGASMAGGGKAGACSGCGAEAGADATAQLHVFSNPLFSAAALSTPKHVC